MCALMGFDRACELHKEVEQQMQEACYCGRVGEIEDREPIVDGDGQEALRCPKCGHLEHLLWLSEDARILLMEGAKHRDSGRRLPAA